MDPRTETAVAVEDLWDDCCRNCLLRKFQGLPCRLMSGYRLHRTVPNEWTFGKGGVIICSDAYTPNLRKVE